MRSCLKCLMCSMCSPAYLWALTLSPPSPPSNKVRRRGVRPQVILYLPGVLLILRLRPLALLLSPELCRKGQHTCTCWHPGTWVGRPASSLLPSNLWCLEATWHWWKMDEWMNNAKTLVLRESPARDKNFQCQPPRLVEIPSQVALCHMKVTAITLGHLLNS